MFTNLKKTKDDKSNFILSGVLAVGLYILFLLLCALYLKSQDIKKFDAISKVTVLELDIVIEPAKDKEKKQTRSKTDQKDTKKSQEIVKKSASTSAKKRSDLKSLFANVKTKAPKVSKEKVLNIRKSTVTSRYKSKFEKQRKSQNVTVSKLLDSVKAKSSAVIPTNTTHKSDKYYSKINELMHSRWKPILIIDGLSAKVLVTIFSDGRFAYKFLSYSGNVQYDDSLKTFLESETYRLYPPYEKGDKTDIEITFGVEG